MKRLVLMVNLILLGLFWVTAPSLAGTEELKPPTVEDPKPPYEDFPTPEWPPETPDAPMEDIDYLAELRVVGLAGCGQNDRVLLVRCERGLDGEISQFGCSPYRQFFLNQTVRVRPGSYLVYFNQSRHYEVLELGDGDSEELHLKKIHLGHVPAGLRAYVFRDLTQQEERDLFVSEVWMSRDSSAFANAVCRTSNFQICQSWQGRPEDLIGSQFVFSHYGSYQSARFYGNSLAYSPAQYVYVHGGGTSGFVSVFPGTYGVAYMGSNGGILDFFLGLRID